MVDMRTLLHQEIEDDVSIAFKTLATNLLKTNVMLSIPLHQPIKKIDFLPENQSHLAGLLSNQQLSPEKK